MADLTAKPYLKAGKNTEIACPHCGVDLIWWVPSGTAGETSIRCCKCKQEVTFRVTPDGDDDAR